jgi:hypothetical protein
MYIVTNVSTYSTIVANIGASSTGNSSIHEAYTERTVQWMGISALRRRGLVSAQCLRTPCMIIHHLASWSSTKRFRHQFMHGPLPSAGVTGFLSFIFLKNIHVNFKGGKIYCQDIGISCLHKWKYKKREETAFLPHLIF